MIAAAVQRPTVAGSSASAEKTSTPPPAGKPTRHESSGRDDTIAAREARPTGVMLRSHFRTAQVFSLRIHEVMSNLNYHLRLIGTPENDATTPWQ